MSAQPVTQNAPQVPEQAISALGAQLRGELIQPSHARYDEARKVYNAMIDRRPALIARCADVADVIYAVNFGRDNGLTVAVRGGGHNGPGLGTCDDGLVIDLSPMRGIRVDPSDKTVRVQGGCVWGDVDHATHTFGLAVPSGIIASTGVGGLTLGGGTGYLSRHYGLTIDNLIEADVVLADGSFDAATVPLAEAARRAPEKSSVREALGLPETARGDAKAEEGAETGVITFEVDAGVIADARKAADGAEAIKRSPVSASAIASLAAALSDREADVREAAAQALGQLEDPRAVEALMRALRNDSDAGVRAMAAWALAQRTGDPAYTGYYERWWSYAERFHVDREQGSWRHELDPANRPSGSVWSGKPDVYHAYQATLLPQVGFAPSIAAALPVAANDGGPA